MNKKEEIEKLDTAHANAYKAYLDAGSFFDDARKARDIAYADYKVASYKSNSYKDKDEMSYTLEEINDAVKNGIPISKDINKIPCTLEEIKAINRAPLYNWDDSDAAYQSDVNAALDTARKASDAAKVAWNDYNDSLNIPNRETWDAACHAYNIAAAAADTAWENVRYSYFVARNDYFDKGNKEK